jgi:hypothetical protein
MTRYSSYGVKTKMHVEEVLSAAQKPDELAKRGVAEKEPADDDEGLY